MPCKIISDRDRKFVSDLWRFIFKELKTDLLYSTAHHPQTNGQSERTNQTVEIKFHYLLINLPDQKQWKKLLPFLTHILNSAPTQPSGYSPHQLMYGLKLNDPTSLMNPNLTAQDFDLRTDARESLQLAAMDIKRAYDKKHTWKAYAPGDQVLIRLHEGYTIPADRRNASDQDQLGTKFQQQFSGPHTVKRRVGRLAYEIKLPVEWKVHPVLPVTVLEPYPGPDPFKQKRGRAERISTDPDGVDRFEIEDIIDKRVRRVGRYSKPITEYRVRWKNASREEDSWLQPYELTDAQEAVADYENRITTENQPAVLQRKRGRPRRIAQAAVNHLRHRFSLKRIIPTA